MAWWPSPNDQVLAAHDLLRNVRGTWLGVTKQGRTAVLTNFHEEGQVLQEARSRGAMVNAFLTQAPDKPENTHAFVENLIEGEGVKGVGGFSLVCGKAGRPLAVVSNRTPSVEGVAWIAEGRGETIGLSNAAFGDRSWPKVLRGEELMSSAIAKSIAREDSKPEFIEELLRVLSVDTLPERQEGQSWTSYVYELRKSIFIPAIGGEGMDGVSADNIAAARTSQRVHISSKAEISKHQGGLSGKYGTQKQTVVLVDHQGHVTLVERTLYDVEGREVVGNERDRVFEFNIEGWEESKPDMKT